MDLGTHGLDSSADEPDRFLWSIASRWTQPPASPAVAVRPELHTLGSHGGAWGCTRWESGQQVEVRPEQPAAMGTPPAGGRRRAAHRWVAWGCLGVHAVGVRPELRQRPGLDAAMGTPAWTPRPGRPGLDAPSIAGRSSAPSSPPRWERRQQVDAAAPKTPPLFYGENVQQVRHVLTERAPPVRVASHRRPM